jgi:hypothetical protein
VSAVTDDGYGSSLFEIAQRLVFDLSIYTKLQFQWLITYFVMLKPFSGMAPMSCSTSMIVAHIFLATGRLS